MVAGKICWRSIKILQGVINLVLVVARRENYYALLGLAEHATARDIKRAYRRLALKWHPDKNEDERAPDRFRLITEAYEVLSDPVQKMRYDSVDNFGLHSFPFEYSSARARDIFNAFFGDKDLFGVFARMQFQHTSGMPESSSRKDGRKSQGGSNKDASRKRCSKEEGATCSSNNKAAQAENRFDDPHASSGNGAESGEDDDDDPDGCFDVQILEDLEPRDGTIKHVAGSACCNEFSQYQTTNLLGCCQRCARSNDCELFNWEPSTGTCWLVRLKGDSLETDVAANRKMGFRPWEIGDETDLEGCFNARIQKDIEPKDGTVKHAYGSACCNKFPQRKPVDLLGCCQRCVNSPQCEIFNWKPSVGTCWLLYYIGSSRETLAATDRHLGNSPAHALA